MQNRYLKLTSAQVDWLIANKRNTKHFWLNPDSGELIFCLCFFSFDKGIGKEDSYFLGSNDYDKLPQTFKQLAQCKN
jgi:hypothetical protein